VAALNKLGYLALVIAPGINPLRHFFDVFVILFCFLYWQRKNWIYFGLAYIFSLIEIFNNSLFGIFILGALLTVFLIKSLVSFEKIWCSVLLFGGGLLTGGVVYQLSNVGIDPMMLYYFKGLAGFLADYRIIFLILFVIGSMYLVLVKPILTKDNFSYFVLFLIIYAQGMLFYYIWGSDLAHFLVIFPIIFFAIFVFVKLCIDHYGVNKAKSFILDVIFMASIILYVPSVVNYYLTKTEFDNIFATHVVYKWNMPTARFISTMDPTYFTDSINLIKAYSTDNSIYIISKYDNFLPFLAQKYSAMPYFDTSWFLMSDRELQKSIAVIKENKPKYLFVDSDINRSYALDIIDGYSIRYYDDLYYESLWRFIRLDGLKKIFYAIENDYRPIKKAYLLTVYERVKK